MTLRAFAGMTGFVHGINPGRQRERPDHDNGVGRTSWLSRPTFDPSRILKDPVPNPNRLDSLSMIH